MIKNNFQIIGTKILVSVVDPWITPNQFSGTILNISKDFEENYIVVKLDEPIIYKDQKCQYFRMSARTFGEKIEELMTKKIIGCDAILIFESDVNIIDTEFSSVWKGKVGMIITVEVK